MDPKAPAARPAAIPGLYPEPSPALKNVLGFRAENDLGESVLESLQELAKMVQERKNAKVSIPEWMPVYERAREIVAGMQEDLDQRITRIRIPAPDEISKLQASLITDPRREAEANRARVRAEFKRLGEEWKNRVQRQLDQHIREPALQSCQKGLELEARRESEQQVFAIASAWPARYQDFLKVTCSQWGEQSLGDLERDLHAAAGGLKMVAPRHRAAPEPDIKLYNQPEPKSVPIPGALEQLFKSLRSGMMLARFMGGLVVTLGGGGVALAAMFGGEDSHTRELLGMGGAALVLLVTPLVMWSARSGSKKELEATLLREQSAFRTGVERWLKESLERSLDRHRERLQREMMAHVGDWEIALDAWWEETQLPLLRTQESEANQRVESMKESAARLTTELGNLRTLRNNVATQLKAIKVRHQEILDEGG